MEDKSKFTWKNELTNKNYNDIGFLLKKSNAPRLSLAYWITVPEFVDKIQKAKVSGVEIDDAYVLDAMCHVYKEKRALKKQGEEIDFNMHLARNAIRHLSGIVNGDRDSWDN